MFLWVGNFVVVIVIEIDSVGGEENVGLAVQDIAADKNLDRLVVSACVSVSYCEIEWSKWRAVMQDCSDERMRIGCT